MRKTAYLSLIIGLISLLSTQIGYTQNYYEGDTLFVISDSGLNLRDDYNLSSQVLNTIKYGESVVVLNTFNYSKNYNQVINSFNGNWIYIDCNGVKGYLFDAYLTKLIPPQHPVDSMKECLESIGIIDEYLREYYKFDPSAKYSLSSEDFIIINNGNESAHDYVEFEVNSHLSYRFHRYWEGLGTEIIFKNVRESEIILLVKLLTERCPFENRAINIVTIDDQESMYSQYTHKKSSPYIYIYKKGEVYGFMLNFYT